MSTPIRHAARTSVRVPEREQLAPVHSLAEHAARTAPDLRVPAHPTFGHLLARVSAARIDLERARAGEVPGLALDGVQAALEVVRAEAVVALERVNPGVPASVLWAHVAAL